MQGAALNYLLPWLSSLIMKLELTAVAAVELFHVLYISPVPSPHLANQVFRILSPVLNPARNMRMIGHGYIGGAANFA